MSQAVALFAKAPVPGKVKTRLASGVGTDGAAELYRCFILDAVELAKRVPGCDVFVFWTPPDELPLLRGLLGTSVTLVPQSEGDLGMRMSEAFSELNARGYASVVITGTDLPTMPLDRLSTAFTLLAQRRAVLGPSLDGGYYLMGLAAAVPELFEGIDWSTAQVLSQTMDRVEKLGIRIECLEPWYDVDTPSDLDFLVAHLRLLRASGIADLPRHTFNWLQQSGRLR